VQFFAVLGGEDVREWKDGGVGSWAGRLALSATIGPLVARVSAAIWIV
jgi:hypothetical protein